MDIQPVRGLSDEFMSDLQGGMLRELCAWVRDDNSLMLAIRNNYINIYYRGGNLMKLSAGKGYAAEFNLGYNSFGHRKLSLPPKKIKTPADMEKWLDVLPDLKQAMDFYKSVKSSSEREFQQVVVKENNRKPIGDKTDYFVVDIEMTFPRETVGLSGAKRSLAHDAEEQDLSDLSGTGPANDARGKIDLIALRVDRAKGKAAGGAARLALIEMKYGTGSLGGSSGLKKHFEDMAYITSNAVLMAALRATAAKQAEQLGALGMWEAKEPFAVSGAKPEIISLIANHGTDPAGIRKTLTADGMAAFDVDPNFDLRFFVARSAGYGLFAQSMLSMTEYIRSLS